MMEDKKGFEKFHTSFEKFPFRLETSAGYLVAIDRDYIGRYKVEVRRVFRTKHHVGSFQSGKYQ